MSLAFRAAVSGPHAPRRARDARTRSTGRRHRVIQKASLSDAVRRAKGGDYNAAAATFVNSFFYDGNVDTRDAEYKGLTRACSSDMKKRYAGDGNALVVILDEDDSRECLACGGVEIRKYVGAVDYETYVKSGRGGMDVEGKIIERPIVANVATARAARRKGYGKAIMSALEAICAENGFDECCLVVEARNKRAQGLYRKLGYKVIGSDAKAAALEVIDGRSKETTTKTLVMRKSLTNPAANVDAVTIAAAVLALALLSSGQQAVVDALYVNFGIDLY